MSQNSVEGYMLCPICVEIMKPPIIQCARGHSMCESCVTSTEITMCVQCRLPLTQTRNYQLEQLISGVLKLMKLNCRYYKEGCKYVVDKERKEEHEAECKFRKFICEGKKFAKWRCEWSGSYSDIYKHFQKKHPRQNTLEWKTNETMNINLNFNCYDVTVISLFSGSSYVYYKHKIDKSKEKVFWTFQLIGLKSQAKNFGYEFEIFNGQRKFKINEICTSDTVDVNEVFEKENCVVLSFAAIKNYLDEDGNLSFKYRIMSLK